MEPTVFVHSPQWEAFKLDSTFSSHSSFIVVYCFDDHSKIWGPWFVEIHDHCESAPPLFKWLKSQIAPDDGAVEPVAPMRRTERLNYSLRLTRTTGETSATWFVLSISFVFDIFTLWVSIRIDFPLCGQRRSRLSRSTDTVLKAFRSSDQHILLVALSLSHLDDSPGNTAAGLVDDRQRRPGSSYPPLIPMRVNSPRTDEFCLDMFTDIHWRANISHPYVWDFAGGGL